MAGRVWICIFCSLVCDFFFSLFSRGYCLGVCISEMGTVESSARIEEDDGGGEDVVNEIEDGGVSVGVQTVERELDLGVFTEPPELFLDTEEGIDGEDDRGEGGTAEEGEDEVVRLRRRIQELEGMVSGWENVARDFLFSLALGPEMTTWYASLLREYLEEALLELPVVEKVNFAECSFPSVPKEAPTMKLVNWGGMSFG